MSPGCDPQPKSRRNWGAGLIFTLALALAPRLSGGTDTNGQTRVTLLPHWIPQAQFAGYYVAAEMGLYREQGLEVVILDGGPRRPVDRALRSGETMFATHFLSSALKLRDAGLPLVHLAQITQRSALMLVAHKSHGIESVTDLDGKKVSLWPGFSVQPQALFRKYNLHVKTITQGATINPFMRGGVDAASAMWYNEYHLFLNSGLDADEVTLIFFDQHDLNFPEDGLYCVAETARRQPELCRRFVRATLAGWHYVFAHMDQSLEIVMRRAAQAHTGTNRPHQRWMLERMRDLIQPIDPTVRLGELSPKAYERVATELKRFGEIQSAPPYEQFHVPLLD
ncbi:MAG: ABC transporter substrate-binding protein [Verrucomicrobia bacterium]|nr:ABC transporter substrate-binding protein [Verrucomicrobiota bacterium]